jgi:hypothetical protein
MLSHRLLSSYKSLKSSLTLIFATITILAKGIEILAHEITLLLAEVRNFHAANEALSKRRRAKRLVSVKEMYLL